MASLAGPSRWRFLVLQRQLQGNNGLLGERNHVSLYLSSRKRLLKDRGGGSCPRFEDGAGVAWSSTRAGVLQTPKQPTVQGKENSSTLRESSAISSIFANDGKGFEDLGLSPLVLERIRALGLSQPTAVQVAAIPTLLAGEDAALQSSTGSGKTLAYVLPLLSKVGPLSFPAEAGPSLPKRPPSGVRAVVMAPSRELAMQILHEVERLLGPDHRSAVQQLIGGANMRRQEEALKKNKPCIVVGTPGRMSDLSRSGRLQTHGCRFLILDEADQLLGPKFRMDMLRILQHVGKQRSSSKTSPSYSTPISASPKPAEASPEPAAASSSPSTPPPQTSLPEERQTILVSATMPPAVLEAAKRWGHCPTYVRATPSGTTLTVATSSRTVTPPSSGLLLRDSTLPLFSDGAPGEARDLYDGVRDSMPPNIEHWYVVAPLRHRVDALRKCLHALEPRSVIVFMNHGRRLKDTEFKLEARGIKAGCLQGDLSKIDRVNMMTAFRDGKVRVLLASDVAARGLDVVDCDLVVNLELPTDGAHYAHRAGRTGRIGRQGTVISICEDAEEFVIQKFERKLKISVTKAELVEGRLVPCNARRVSL